MRKLALFLPLVCGLISTVLLARQDPAACGTHSEKTREELYLHRRSAARHVRPISPAAALATASGLPAQPQARDIGNIALIDDSDGVVDRRNPFDLNQKTLSFVPANAKATSYSFQVSDASYDPAAAQAGTRLILADDDSKQVALPFAFPFFGASYQQIFINSDGNVTFAEGDSASSDRSLGRMMFGPPRIAPLYADLDPSASSKGVLITSEPSRLVVSWVQVPVYSDFGGGRAQTFQLRLYPGGRIEVAWQDSIVDSAVVGIAPGRLQGAGSVLSFAGGSTQQYSAAIAESFSGSDKVDIVTAAQKFYATHEDAYDYLVMFNGEGVPAGSGVVAFEVTARNSRTGYGDSLVDDGQEFGSPQRLQSVLNMGPLNQYPTDPNAIVPARYISRDTPLTVLGHEAGHLFLAFVSVPDPNSPTARPMLGRALVHWSFLFNSEASLLEGNRIQDNGPNAAPRFTTAGTVQGYSALDQYLMGFRPPEEVPSTFVVTNSSDITSGAMPPQTGVSFNGQRRDIAIDELIAAAGRRTPDSTVAQRRFRFAFLLIVPPGTTPSPDQLAQIEAYRSNFETFYGHAAGDRASADATLKHALHLSAFPATGVVAGSNAQAFVMLDAPLSSPLTVLLHGSSGAMSVPASVTIPAGAKSATFSIAGLRAGVDALSAEPVDSSYETALANIQVLASTGALKLKVVSGDQQAAVPGQPLSSPIVIRVSDGNELPYAGVPVAGAVSGGGAAEAVAITDVNGLARFHWAPGAGPANELTLSIVNGPKVTVVALGKPAFAAGAVVNAASFEPGISPGSIATLFGANLTDASVSIDGIPATVFYAGSQQVNFLVPASVTGDLADVIVSTPIGSTAAVKVPVAVISPGIFAAVNRGSYVEIYATGLGPVLDGQTVNPVQVAIGQSEVQVLYSGLAPGFAGLYQINATLPQGLAAGNFSVSFTIGGKQSNTVQSQ